MRLLFLHLSRYSGLLLTSILLFRHLPCPRAPVRGQSVHGRDPDDVERRQIPPGASRLPTTFLDHEAKSSQDVATAAGHQLRTTSDLVRSQQTPSEKCVTEPDVHSATQVHGVGFFQTSRVFFEFAVRVRFQCGTAVLCVVSSGPETDLSANLRRAQNV